jgi:hypothetical protein
MSAYATKLHVARMAAIEAFDEAIKERVGQDALDLLKAAIDRFNEAEKLRQKAKK